MFNKASEVNLNYAIAHAGVAGYYSQLYTYFAGREFNLRQADATSSRALELEPDLAEARLSRGLAISLRERFGEAELGFEQAFRLDPQLFDAFHCYGQAKL